jgi:branched-chain amino acid transport system permease protein
MKHRFLGQSLWFWLIAAGVFVLIQGFFALSRFDIPVISTIGGAYAQRIFLSSGVMAIVALGLNLIYGFNGQFSLGQWGLYAIGAYTAADITYRWNRGDSSALLFVLAAVLLLALVYGLISRLTRVRLAFMDEMSRFTLYLLGTGAAVGVSVLLAGLLTAPVDAVLGLLPPAVSMQIVFVLATLCAGAIAGLISYLFGQPVLKLGGDYFGIATLGLTMVVFVLANNSDKVFPEMKGSRGMVGIPTLTTWFWVFVFLLVVVVITRNLLDSSHGRAMISIREDEIAAKTMGVDTTQYKTLAFVIGSFFAGLAGSLFAHQEGFLHPSTFNFVKSFDPLIIIVFGGLGSVTGTVLASFVWGIVLFYVLPTVLPQGGEGWRFVIYALALLIIMLLRQQGLLGGREWGFLKPTRWPLSGRLGGQLNDGGGGQVEPAREPQPATTTSGPQAEAH